MSSVHIELHYEGHHGCDSICDVLIEHGTDAILVTVTERDDNPGTSITNCAEIVATQIARTMPSASMPEVRFVEHYPTDPNGSFDEVTFTWTERQASGAQWRHLGVGGYHQLRAELGVP